MALLHLLTFPGGLLPDRVAIGTPQSTAWVFLLWMAGYAALTLAAIVLEAFSANRHIGHGPLSGGFGLGVAVVAVAVGGVAVGVTTLADGLPPLVQDGIWTAVNQGISYLAIAMMAAGVAIVLAVIRQRNPLFLWLGLALTVTLAANILSLAGGGRYTIGWSAGRLGWLLSACV